MSVNMYEALARLASRLEQRTSAERLVMLPILLRWYSGQSSRGERTWRAVRDGDLKYLSRQQGPAVEEWLFDLKSDPGEKTDLKDKRREDLRRLRSLLRLPGVRPLEAHRLEVVDPGLRSLTNVNRPEDLAALASILGGDDPTGDR